MIERRISLDMDELIVAAARNPERTFAAHLLSWCRNFGQRAKLMSSDDQRSGDQTQPVQLGRAPASGRAISRSEEHTSELQSLMRISYAGFCLKKKTYRKDEN